MGIGDWATIPIYGDKTYVKVLRMPKHVKLSFKNNEVFEKTKEHINVSSNSNKSSNPLKDSRETGKESNSKLIDLNNTNNSTINMPITNSNIPVQNFNSGSSNSEKTNSKNKIPATKSANNLIDVESDFYAGNSINNPNNNLTKNSSSNIINNNSNLNSNLFNIDNFDVSKIGNMLHEINENTFQFVNVINESKESSTNNKNQRNENVGNKSNNSTNSGLFEIFNSSPGEINNNTNSANSNKGSPEVNQGKSNLNNPCKKFIKYFFINFIKIYIY